MTNRLLATFSTLALAVLPLAAQGGKAAAKGLPKPECADGRLDVFYVGHSLMVGIADVVGTCFAARKSGAGQLDYRFREQHKIGASLASQFDEAAKPPAQRVAQEPQFMGIWSDEFVKGGWDALVLIDSVPRSKPEMPETLDYVLRFAKELAVKSPQARVLVYEPWHCIHTGTTTPCPYDRGPTMRLPWLERIAADAPMWDEVVADAQKALPKSKFALVPAGRALGMLVAAAEAGTVDGCTGIGDFFEDDIHLTRYGKYLVGLVHYAVLSGQSPLGLPNDVRDRWGGEWFSDREQGGKVWKAPSAAATKRMQEIAWAAVQGKPDPGAGKAGKKKAAAGK